MSAVGPYRRGANKLGGQPFSKTHGLRQTPTGNTWSAMMTRCFNPKCGQNWEAYGARGITVCNGLRASPAALVKAIGVRPNGKTLDRKNNDGSYTCGACEECKALNWPMNIRWASRREQSKNTRLNRRVEINGETKLATEWAAQAGLPVSTFFNRLNRGQTGAALLLPAAPLLTLVAHHGETHHVSEWARRTGIKMATLSARVRNGDAGDFLFRPTGHRGKDKKPRKTCSR